MLPGSLARAVKLPNGARFYRCALQVNPYEYVKRHDKPTSHKDEAAYNAAIIKACCDEGVEVIGVADHYQIRTSESLIEAARAAGIVVFPGFEAETRDGVHFICLFGPGCTLSEIDRIIGDCGIHLTTPAAETPSYDSLEFPTKCRYWGAVCIAAHVASEKGLLQTLSGQARIKSWCNPDLIACSLPGPVSNAPENLRPILENKNKDHERVHPMAIINSQDVCCPEDVKRRECSTLIKMSSVSIDGLRQAFLDPESRIRLLTDTAEENHTELLAVAWEGGFLDKIALHLNENMNAIIGGRGTGKSTVLESIRYALGLEPVGEDARKTHDGIVRHVLQPGTRVSVLVRSYRPDIREYAIERTVPNSPSVKDRDGNVLPIEPKDVVPGIEIYGQHEVSELTRNPEKLTRLLDRFVENNPDQPRRKADLKDKLRRSREEIIRVSGEIKRTMERLGELPAVEETLKRYKDAGLEELLRDQTLLVKEEHILKTADDRLQTFRSLPNQVRRGLPLDRDFVSDASLEDLPGKDILKEIGGILQSFEDEMMSIATQYEQALKRAQAALATVRAVWDNRRKSVTEAYERILRELQKAKVDGNEFILLRRRFEELKPLDGVKHQQEKALEELTRERERLLNDWEECRRQEFSCLEKAAKKVNRHLAGRVQVEVQFEGNREPLAACIRSLGGRLSDTVEALSRREGLRLREFSDTCRSGKDALVKKYSLPPNQADRLALAGDDFFLRLEEIELPSTTSIKLNVSQEGQPPEWKSLEQLSTGQKATAILLLLLLESRSPLIVDQPEDDLDNRFIADSIIPKLRSEKRQRQFVFATHSANIAVLGDADLIVGLSAAGEADGGRATIPHHHMGSIDSEPVRLLVEQILEGGKLAFETRRRKYGF